MAKRARVTTQDNFGRSYDVDTGALMWRPSVYGIVVKNGKILLAKQFGAYNLPGGGVDLGETLEDAVLREVFEETGIVASSPRLLNAATSLFTWADEAKGILQHYHAVLLYYRCKFVSGELSTAGFDEYEKNYAEISEWVPIKDLGLVKTGGTADWLKVVQEHILKT